MKSSLWKYEKIICLKPQGDVWKVKNSSGAYGYHKSTVGKKHLDVGTLVANEYITASLAKRLGFPTAKLVLAQIIGPKRAKRRGLISIQKHAHELRTWNKANRKIKAKPEQYLTQLGHLKTLVVFDAWIANLDRGPGENLVLYRKKNKKKYNWYLIDHTNALLGAPFKWRKGSWKKPYWDKIWLYSHVQRGMLRLQSSKPALMKMVKRIQALSAKDIDKAIASAPSGYMNKKERKTTRSLLLYRQKRLQMMILQWLQYKGIKEI